MIKFAVENGVKIRDDFRFVHTYVMFFQLENHRNTEWKHDREASNKNKRGYNSFKIVFEICKGGSIKISNSSIQNT